MVSNKQTRTVEAAARVLAALCPPLTAVVLGSEGALNVALHGSVGERSAPHITHTITSICTYINIGERSAQHTHQRSSTPTVTLTLITFNIKHNEVMFIIATTVVGVGVATRSFTAK